MPLSLFEDDDDRIEKAEELKKQVLEFDKNEFIKGCYEAYDMLCTSGEAAIQGADTNDIGTAINRMTALFLIREEYERCQFLKSFVAKHIPGFEIIPDKNVKKEMSL